MPTVPSTLEGMCANKPGRKMSSKLGEFLACLDLPSTCLRQRPFRPWAAGSKKALASATRALSNGSRTRGSGDPHVRFPARRKNRRYPFGTCGDKRAYSRLTARSAGGLKEQTSSQTVTVATRHRATAVFPSAITRVGGPGWCHASGCGIQYVQDRRIKAQFG
jgi:hypothetical protein